MLLFRTGTIHRAPVRALRLSDFREPEYLQMPPGKGTGARDGSIIPQVFKISIAFKKSLCYNYGILKK